MFPDLIEKLGPLAPLAGVWEGSKGDDTAPSDDRGTERNLFRERMTFVPLSPVNNHEQVLYGLRYSTTAFRIGETNAFHEELGYWLWDPLDGQVLRCFMVPRGVTIIAGGKVDPKAKSFELKAAVGSHTYGICSSLFLDREFKTMAYTLKLSFIDAKSFSYEEDTELKLKGQTEIFHHIDKNTLQKVT